MGQAELEAGPILAHAARQCLGLEKSCLKIWQGYSNTLPNWHETYIDLAKSLIAHVQGQLHRQEARNAGLRETALFLIGLSCDRYSDRLKAILKVPRPGLLRDLLRGMAIKVSESTETSAKAASMVAGKRLLAGKLPACTDKLGS